MSKPRSKNGSSNPFLAGDPPKATRLNEHFTRSDGFLVPFSGSEEQAVVGVLNVASDGFVPQSASKMSKETGHP
jgi:hypothetical protein